MEVFTNVRAIEVLIINYVLLYIAECAKYKKQD